jgi:hypothetical protein
MPSPSSELLNRFGARDLLDANRQSRLLDGPTKRIAVRAACAIVREVHGKSWHEV